MADLDEYIAQVRGVLLTPRAMTVRDFDDALAALDIIEEKDADWRATFAGQAFTAPDADWATIFDSYKARHDDALARIHEYETPTNLRPTVDYDIYRAAVEECERYRLRLKGRDARIQELEAAQRATWRTSETWKAAHEQIIDALRDHGCGSGCTYPGHPWRSVHVS